jgi:GT2 family glycosyltransferase
MKDDTRPKLSFIIPVLHLKRPKNPTRFFLPRYTVDDTLGDISANVSLPYETVVVCNGDDTDLRRFVEKDLRIHKYCINKTNVGVARGWNMGAQLAEGEVLCFVNDDVEIGAGAIESLYAVLTADTNVGQVGPKGAKWRDGAHERYVGEHEMEEADAISGFLFMIPSVLYREIGGFDVRYTPAGFEEIDMSFEIRRRGRKCIVVPQLAIRHHHHHGVSSYRTEIEYLGKSIDTESLHRRNKEYFLSKWKDFRAA